MKWITVFLMFLLPVSVKAQTYNGHDYVDLGLSVMWAKTNVGARTPIGSGYHYAWGETEAKKIYDWDTYKWGIEGELTKYSEQDGKTVLDADDDVAHVAWGGLWHTPTIDDINELIEKCDWKWEKRSAEYGYNITGPSGNSIFLSASGGYDDNEDNSSAPLAPEDYEHIFGCYWSSNCDNQFCSLAARLCIDENSYEAEAYESRSYGYSIRPVVHIDRKTSESHTSTTSQSATVSTTSDKIHEGTYTYSGIFYVDGNINAVSSGTPEYMTLYNDHLLIQYSNGTSRTLKRINDTTGQYVYKNSDTYKYVFDSDFNLNTYTETTMSYLGITMTSVMKSVYVKGEITNTNTGASSGHLEGYSNGGYNNSTVGTTTCNMCSGTGRCSVTTTYNKYYCQGTGLCKYCDGKGWDVNPYTQDRIKCAVCNGTGRCSYCGGSGRCHSCNGRGVK